MKEEKMIAEGRGAGARSLRLNTITSLLFLCFRRINLGTDAPSPYLLDRCINIAEATTKREKEQAKIASILSEKQRRPLMSYKYRK